MRVDSRADTVQGFLGDESNAYHALADRVEAVFFPQSEEDVVEVVQMANLGRKRISVSGAGTGITGARVPMEGGIVVSFDEMLKPALREGFQRLDYTGLRGEATILIDEEMRLAVAPPGVPLLEFAGALPRALIYPPDPTETSAQLGGTVATNASGARCFHYGATREWVEGLRVVIGNGDVLSIKRGDTFANADGTIRFEGRSGTSYALKLPTYSMPSTKHNAGLFSKPGMDLVDIFIGSEGILGIITEVTARLAPKPPNVVSDIAFFRGAGDAEKYADWLRPMKSQGVLSIEYFDEGSLRFISEERPEIPDSAKSAIFLELASENVMSLAPIDDMLGKLSPVEDWCALNEKEVRGLKEFRHSLPDRVNAYLRERGSHKLGTDMAVPERSFPEMMEFYRDIGESFKAQFQRGGEHCAIFGHIGDCHLHFNFLAQTADEMKRAKELYVAMARKAISLGGTISAEHGIGKKTMAVDGRQVPYLELMYGEKGLREIAGVKKTVDPNNVLNLGNIVPVSYTL